VCQDMCARYVYVVEAHVLHRSGPQSVCGDEDRDCIKTLSSAFLLRYFGLVVACRVTTVGTHLWVSPDWW